MADTKPSAFAVDLAASIVDPGTDCAAARERFAEINARIIDAALLPLVEALIALEHGLRQVRRTVDGSQPKDIPGAVMAIDWLIGDANAAIRRQHERTPECRPTGGSKKGESYDS